MPNYRTFPEKAGVDPRLMFDANARIPPSQIDDLTDRAVSLTGDDVFGIKQAGYFRPAHLGAFGFAWLASPTLRIRQPALRSLTQAGSGREAAEWRLARRARSPAGSDRTAVGRLRLRGELSASFTYRELKRDALVLARKLASLGCIRGSRGGIVAETDPMFRRFFFARQFAGLIPVALPAGPQLGAHKAYVGKLRRVLESCGAKIAVSPASHLAFLEEAVTTMNLVMSGAPEDFDALPENSANLEALSGNETAYLQYTSGSTQFPRGVEIDQSTALNNLLEIATHGLRLDRNDRFVSWLPFHHDMGMIGFILVPLICQLSVDYLAPATFALRPRLRLKLISDNRGTVSSSPTFGYALCARRLRPSDCSRYDLSSWRAAAVGAEQIKPQALKEFADALAPAGFYPKAFVACYGMAETLLAVSFARLGEGLRVDLVNQDLMTATGQALPAHRDDPGAAGYVDCGTVLPGFEFRICGPEGEIIPQRMCGAIFLKRPSVMRGYFEDEVSTRQVLSPDGWLDTGDIGYRIGSNLVITVRSKDVIIVRGRKI